MGGKDTEPCQQGITAPVNYEEPVTEAEAEVLETDDVVFNREFIAAAVRHKFSEYNFIRDFSLYTDSSKENRSIDLAGIKSRYDIANDKVIETAGFKIKENLNGFRNDNITEYRNYFTRLFIVVPDRGDYNISELKGEGIGIITVDLSAGANIKIYPESNSSIPEFILNRICYEYTFDSCLDKESRSRGLFM
jgi:hypothetical protein